MTATQIRGDKARIKNRLLIALSPSSLSAWEDLLLTWSTGCHLSTEAHVTVFYRQAGGRCHLSSRVPFQADKLARTCIRNCVTRKRHSTFVFGTPWPTPSISQSFHAQDHMFRNNCKPWLRSISRKFERLDLLLLLFLTFVSLYLQFLNLSLKGALLYIPWSRFVSKISFQKFGLKKKKRFLLRAFCGCDSPVKICLNRLLGTADKEIKLLAAENLDLSKFHM